MHTDLKRHLQRLLAATGLGTLTISAENSHNVVVMAAFSKEAVMALWARIVFDLSTADLVNGILDIPLSPIDDETAVIWIKDLPLICRSVSSLVSKQKIIRPALPDATCLAIGGPSGVGKTTLIEKLRNSSLGNRVRRYVAYTTRPKRTYERQGIDYHFVKTADIGLYRSNPRFINFVEARGYWYWTDPSAFFESRWLDEGAIHIFAVTQVHEFLERRKTIPDLRWVWLHASEEALRRRLQKRGDLDIEKSLEQNQRLMMQDRTGLVSLDLDIESGDIAPSVSALLQFIGNIERKPT